MRININNVIDTIFEQLGTPQCESEYDYDEEDVKSILSKYKKTSLSFLSFAKEINNFSITKYDDNNEVIHANMVYDPHTVKCAENEIIIIRRNLHSILELVKSTESLSPYKMSKELTGVPCNYNAIKEKYEFWRNGFHISNFTTYVREYNNQIVGEKYERGYSLTQSPYLMTGAPFQGNIFIKYSKSNDAKISITVNDDIVKNNYRLNDVMSAIDDEYITLIDETTTAITSGKVKRLKEMRY